MNTTIFSTGPLWRRLAAAAVAAIAVNLVLLVLGHAAGGSFVTVGPDGSDLVIGVVPIILVTVLALAVGGVARAVLGRFSWGVRTVQIAAVVLTVLSLGPLAGLDVELTTQLTLGAMHLVVGAAYLLAIAPERGATTPSESPQRATAEVR